MITLLEQIVDSITEELESVKDMPNHIYESLGSIFPDWLKTIVVLTIAALTSAITTIARAKHAQTAIKFSIWASNVGLALVVAFIVDSIVLLVQPDINIRAELAIACFSGLAARDLFEIIEMKGLEWIRWKVHHTKKDKKE